MPLKKSNERLVRKEANVKPRNVIDVNKTVTTITIPRKPSVMPSQAKNKGKIYINEPAKLDLIALKNPYL